MIGFQFGITAADEKTADARIFQAKTNELSAERPRFSAAPCASVGGEGRRGGKKEFLTLVRSAGDPQDASFVFYDPSSKISCSKTRVI